MKRVSDNHPSSGFTYVTAIVLLLFAAIAYAVYVLAPPYMADWNWRREINAQMIKASEKSDSEIRQELMRQAGLLNIPIESGSLDIYRYANEIKITYEYERKVALPGLKSLHFENSMKRQVTKVQHLFNKQQ